MSWKRAAPPRARASTVRSGPGRIDLHMHSDRSDGRVPPEELLARAARARLDWIAITEHDLPNPIAAGVHDVEGHAVRVIAGVELSGTHEGCELHLLVYFPGEMPEAFRAFLVERARLRAERYDVAVARTGVRDVPLADEAARAGLRSLTRHHLYRALLERGHVKDPHEGWALLGGSGIVPLIDLPFLEAIRRAREAGGLTSWAHPPFDAAQAHTALFVAHGLQGLEAVRPRQDRRTRNALRRLADKHGLVLTGGSDWHGWGDGELGLFAVSGERARRFAERLEAAAADAQRESA